MLLLNILVSGGKIDREIELIIFKADTEYEQIAGADWVAKSWAKKKGSFGTITPSFCSKSAKCDLCRRKMKMGREDFGRSVRKMFH